MVQAVFVGIAEGDFARLILGNEDVDAVAEVLWCFFFEAVDEGGS